jgi:UDP:flavonoid glycosyltransferase YjiC (YdhE family)
MYPAHLSTLQTYAGRFPQQAMRTLILTLGTRGDLELFVLLARTLLCRGHAVQLITSRFHAEPVLKAGIPGAFTGSTSSESLNTLLANLQHEPDLGIRTRKYVEGFLRPELAAARRDIAELAAETDYFVSNLKITIGRGDTIIPTAFVTYDPPASLSELDRYSSALPRERILELVAYPRPLPDPGSRWPERFHFTGFWLPALSVEPLSPAVERYLSSGSPPVVLTAGSMRMFDAPRLEREFAGALARLDMRGIVINGTGIAAFGAPLLHTGDVSYGTLFPRTSGVVHHGGVGTTAEVLRAGKPSIVLPQTSAQRDMADLLIKNGVGTAVFDPARVSAGTLATPLARLRNDSMNAAAMRFSDMIARDRGVEGAAEEIEKHWSATTI